MRDRSRFYQSARTTAAHRSRERSTRNHEIAAAPAELVCTSAFVKVFPFAREGEPECVDAPWQTLLLLCERCKGGRHGLDARAIRKGLKHRLGKSKSLRVLECDCLGVCPEHAVTTCIVRAGSESELLVVRSEDELEALARKLP
jgi:hypothetical protein